MENNILKVEHISHSFKREGNKRAVSVLHDVSFSVKKGEFLALIGPSGSGKSTLLKIIAGILKPTSGRTENSAATLAMVFQNYAVFPWLTVIENVEFGLRMAGVPKGKRRKIALEKIADIKLTSHENSYVRELSGGMRQRIGIARALAISPDLLLMDEPFSGLDELTAQKLRHDLLEVWHKYKMTIILVTHLVEEAVSMSDRVLVLSASPAKVKKVVPINLERPRAKRSAEYFALVDEVTGELEV